MYAIKFKSITYKCVCVCVCVCVYTCMYSMYECTYCVRVSSFYEWLEFRNIPKYILC